MSSLALIQGLTGNQTDIWESSAQLPFSLPYSGFQPVNYPQLSGTTVVSVGSSSLCWSHENILKQRAGHSWDSPHELSLGMALLVLHVVWHLKAVASCVFGPILWLGQAGKSDTCYSVIAWSTSLLLVTVNFLHPYNKLEKEEWRWAENISRMPLAWTCSQSSKLHYYDFT